VSFSFKFFNEPFPFAIAGHAMFLSVGLFGVFMEEWPKEDGTQRENLWLMKLNQRTLTTYSAIY